MAKRFEDRGAVHSVYSTGQSSRETLVFIHINIFSTASVLPFLIAILGKGGLLGVGRNNINDKPNQYFCYLDKHFSCISLFAQAAEL